MWDPYKILGHCNDIDTAKPPDIMSRGEVSLSEDVVHVRIRLRHLGFH
jgi:hypothetical protein